MKKFYIHIGLPKAYSSSIQAYINKQINKDYFFINQEKKSINNYGFLKKNTYKFGKRPILNYQLLSKKEIIEYRSKISNLKYKKIIISDESFFGNPYTNFSDRSNIIKNIKSICIGEIKILISLRNQLDWARSLYNTSIQQGCYVDFKEFTNKIGYLSVDMNKIDYSKALKDFSIAFGKKNIKVIFCESEINLFKDSIDTFFDFKKKLKIFPKKNQSFPRKYLIFRKYLNKYLNQNIIIFFNNFRIIYFLCIFFGFFLEKLSSKTLNYNIDLRTAKRINKMNRDLFSYLRLKEIDDYFLK